MALFADAAESISYGDLTDKILRSTNSWSLLPTQVSNHFFIFTFANLITFSIDYIILIGAKEKKESR